VILLLSSQTSPLAAIDESKVSPGAIGTLVVFLLCVATFFLLRNFFKRLSRLRKDQ
jgi:hypothetical protein